MISLGFLLLLFYISHLCMAIWFLKPFRLNGISKKYLVGAFLLKIFAAYTMVLVYTYIYPKRNEADIFKFFDDSEQLHQLLFTHPSYYLQVITGIYLDPEAIKSYLNGMHWWYKPLYPDAYNEARVMIRLNAILRIFSGGYYMIHAVFICFLSMIGSIKMYKLALRLSFQHKNVLLLGTILLLPSVVFWCSGVLKEGLVLFIISGLLYHLYWLSVSGYSNKHMLYTLGYVVLAALTKPFILICMAPGLLALVFFKLKKMINQKQVILLYAFVNLLCLLVFFNSYHLGHAFDMVYQLCYKRGEYIYLAEHSGMKNLLFNNYLNFTWWKIIKEMPVALFHSLFSPLPWTAYNLLTTAAAIENVLFIALCLYPFLKPKPQSINFEKNFQLSTFNFQLFIFNFLLCTFILIGLTTPIAGSLVRYKAPFLLLIPILINAFRSLKAAQSA